MSLQRTPSEFALVQRDGTVSIVDVGAPANLVWLGDTYPDAELNMDRLTADKFPLIARLVHHVVAPERDFAEWLETVDLITGDDDDIEQAKADLAASNGHPTSADVEHAPAASAGIERVST
jgi:hypothetical protein